jgi:hypothetical protein
LVKKTLFLRFKKISFIYFLLPKKIPEFNFILSAGFTFAGVWTQREIQNCKNISICPPTNYGSAEHRGYQGGEKIISVNKLRAELGLLIKIKIMFSSWFISVQAPVPGPSLKLGQ